MSIFEKLKADHEDATTLLDTVLVSSDGAERQKLFKQFVTEITAHNRAEEKVLYANLEKYEDTKDDALESEEEHRFATLIIESLDGASRKTSDRWTARCNVLKEVLRRHIEEEEGDIFQKAEDIFDERALQDMGEQFEQEKRKHLK